MTELDRWRLVLGRFAADHLGVAASGSVDARRTQALDYLYRRAYAGRGVEGSSDADVIDDVDPGPGSRELSNPHTVAWLGEVRGLFDDSVSEVIVAHALQRFGLAELLTDPRILETIEPDLRLLATVLSLRRSLPSGIDAPLRAMIRRVVDQLTARLRTPVHQALATRRRPYRHSPTGSGTELDIAATVARNLKNYDPDRNRLIVEELKFFDRHTTRLKWDVIVCVDQSGSMAESMIHSAVMAAIFGGIASLRVHLVVFDTSVTDLSRFADDPVEVLMTVQLGGGTDIAGALAYCGTLVRDPSRTAIVVITDFCEGGSPAELVRVTGELAGSGIKLLGLASLAESSGSSRPFFDREMAQRLSDVGMRVAALGPHELTDWLLETMS